MLMLNTDLHIADLSKHMSRGDFVRNAMRAIQESLPERRDSEISTNSLTRKTSATDSGSNVSIATPTKSTPTRSRARPATASGALQSFTRSASAPVAAPPPAFGRQESERSVSVTGSVLDVQARGSVSTVDSFTYSKAWESDAENALKVGHATQDGIDLADIQDIYSQVRADKILLPINNTTAPENNRHSIISVASDRTGRIASGRSNDRLTALKRGSVRGMQGVINFPYNASFASSEGRLSPTPSHSTSTANSLGEAISSIGFASNLSQAVIKEHDDEVHQNSSARSVDTDDRELDDDELALLGPPWAKEGMVWKRMEKEKGMRMAFKSTWGQVFVVVQRGEISVFTFATDSSKSRNGAEGAVGGGNWLNNANLVTASSLVHSTAAIVPGGMGRDRPYVFKVDLQSGEEMVFQAGTDDLAMEWVSTCNYWAARRSRHPLAGGVSNMEYGWNRVLPDADYATSTPNTSGGNGGGNGYPGRGEDDRASIMSSGTHGGRRSFGSARDPFVNDWKAPPAPEQPSSLDEEAQLDALVSYAQELKAELESHRALEEPMRNLVSVYSTPISLLISLHLKGVTMGA